MSRTWVVSRRERSRQLEWAESPHNDGFARLITVPPTRSDARRLFGSLRARPHAMAAFGNGRRPPAGGAAADVAVTADTGGCATCSWCRRWASAAGLTACDRTPRAGWRLARWREPPGPTGRRVPAGPAAGVRASLRRPALRISTRPRVLWWCRLGVHCRGHRRPAPVVRLPGGRQARPGG